MKKLLIVICGIVTISCQAALEHATAIPMTNFLLSMPESVEVILTPEDSSAYKNGMRVYIASHDADEFVQLMKERKYEDYFGMHIYEGKSWNGDMENWLHEECVGPAQISESFTKDEIKIFRFSKCLHDHTFAVTEGSHIYKIVATADTSNEMLIWEILKTARLKPADN